MVPGSGAEPAERSTFVRRVRLRTSARWARWGRFAWWPRLGRFGWWPGLSGFGRWARRGAPARPTTVAAAVGCLLAVAVFALVGASTSAAFGGAHAGRRRELSVRGDTWPGIEHSMRIATDISVAVGLGVASGLLVLALCLWRGRNAARVATGLVAGPFLGWALCSAAVSAGVVGFYPDWVRVSLLVAQLASALLYVAAVVLLALPPSNAFFRPTAPERWEPDPADHSRPSPRPAGPKRWESAGAERSRIPLRPAAAQRPTSGEPSDDGVPVVRR